MPSRMPAASSRSRSRGSPSWPRSAAARARSAAANAGPSVSSRSIMPSAFDRDTRCGTARGLRSQPSRRVRGIRGRPARARRRSDGPGSCVTSLRRGSASRSHSVSATRRPSVASSTERTRPLRWVNDWPTQMTPHFNVPSPTQKRSVASSTRPPARAFVRGRAGRRPSPKPPTRLSGRRSATTSRRASRGLRRRSPRCASSQSSTARMPSGPTMKLPLRKSPCTSPVRAGAVGHAVGEPAQAELERGVRLAERVEQRRGTGRVGRRRPALVGVGGTRDQWRGCGPRSRRIASPVAGSSLGVRLRRGESCGESSRLRRGPSRSPDPRSSAAWSRTPHRGERRRPRRPRPLQQEVFGGAIGFAAVFARVAAQDESVGGARGVDEVERPRFPGRAARESAQPDDRTGPARRHHHLGQCFGIGRAGHERRRYPSPRTGVGVAPI